MTRTRQEMAIDDLMSHLPHRFPFLFVDKVVDCHPGTDICGLKRVSRADCSFLRFPAGVRAFPQLLVVEALAQVSVILARETLGIPPTQKRLMFFAGIDAAQFHGGASPGDCLLLRSRVRRIRKNVGWFTGTAEVDGTRICEVQISAAWSDSAT